MNRSLMILWVLLALFSAFAQGQERPTAEVVGDLPTDKGVSFVYFLKRAAIVSGALVAYSVVRYFLGY